MVRSESALKWVEDNLLFSGEALESDDRKPSIVFLIPEFILRLLRQTSPESKDGGYQLGLVAPKFEFWIALITSLLLGVLFSMLISITMYQMIVLPRKTKKVGVPAFMIGFGIIMPVCAISPYYIIRYFHITNKLIKFLSGIAQVVGFFRCSEAMFGFLPANVDDSLSNFMIYNLFPAEVKFNTKGPVKSTWSQVYDNGARFVKYIFIFGLYSSFLFAYDYQPFAKDEGSQLMDVNIRTGFYYGQMINNALIARECSPFLTFCLRMFAFLTSVSFLICSPYPLSLIMHPVLFQIYLSTFGTAIFLLASLCGLDIYPMMLNPIFESSSVRDFWGRRWNMTIHGLLKRGVYKPVRTKYSRLVASTSAFLASGIFHEWLLSSKFQY